MDSIKDNLICQADDSQRLNVQGTCQADDSQADDSQLLNVQGTCQLLNVKLLSDRFTCPISKQIFRKAVVAEDGFTYEKKCIEEWLKNNDTSPTTREKISKSLHDVKIINNLIDNITNLEYLRYDDVYKNDIDDIIKCLNNKNYIKLILKTFKYKQFKERRK